jgi:hypothetical protein
MRGATDEDQNKEEKVLNSEKRCERQMENTNVSCSPVEGADRTTRTKYRDDKCDIKRII